MSWRGTLLACRLFTDHAFELVYRHLGGKAPVLKEDDILQVAARVESTEARGKTGSIRRMDRQSR